MQAGFRAVIAPGKGEGFADIFESNAFQNGLLVIELPESDWQSIATAVREHPGSAEAAIDLQNQTITLHQPDAGSAKSPTTKFDFEIPETYRHRLLHGLDAIAETLLQDAKIKKYEQNAQAWLLSRRESA